VPNISRPDAEVVQDLTQGLPNISRPDPEVL